MQIFEENEPQEQDRYAENALQISTIFRFSTSIFFGLGGLIATLCYAYISTLTWARGDDYIWTLTNNRDGFAGLISDGVKGGGRVLSYVVIAGLFRTIDMTVVTTFLATLGYIISIYIVQSMYFSKLPLKASERVAMHSVPLIYLLRSTDNHVVGEAVFWASGATTYAFPLFFGLLWIAVSLNPPKYSTKWCQIPLYALTGTLSLLAGTGNEALSFALFCAFVTNCALDHKRRSWTGMSLKLVPAGCYIVGMLWLYLGPRTTSRAHNFQMDSYLDNMSRVFPLIQTHLIDSLRFGSLAGIIIGFLFSTNPLLQRIPISSTFTSRWLMWLAAMLGSMITLSLAPLSSIDTAPRAFLFLRFFSFYGIMGLTATVATVLYTCTEVSRFRVSAITYIIFVSLLILSTTLRWEYRLIAMVRDFRRYHAERVSWHMIMIGARGQDLVLKRTVQTPPLSPLPGIDIQDENPFWINHHVARFYNLSSVRTESL